VTETTEYERVLIVRSIEEWLQQQADTGGGAAGGMGL